MIIFYDVDEYELNPEFTVCKNKKEAEALLKERYEEYHAPAQDTNEEFDESWCEEDYAFIDFDGSTRRGLGIIKLED